MGDLEAKSMGPLDHIRSGLKGVGDAAFSLAKIYGMAFLGMGAVAGYALKQSAEFEADTLLLVTHASMAVGSLNDMRVGFLKLAPQVGFTADELAKAHYWIQSVTAGALNEAQALAWQTNAAKTAQMAHADLAKTTDTLALVMKSFFGVNGDSAVAAGQLSAAVGAGVVTMDQMNQAMSTGLIPTAFNAHISFADMAAGMDTLTESGFSASTAATALRNGINYLMVSSDKGTATLKSLGLTHKQLADEMAGPGGLAGAYGLLGTALEKLPDATAKDQAIRDMFGGLRGTAAAETVITNLKQMPILLGDITKGGADFSTNWAKYMGTTLFQTQSVKASFSDLSIMLGDALAPAFQKVMGFIGPLIMRFAEWVADHTSIVSSFIQTSMAVAALGLAFFGLVAIFAKVGGALLTPEGLGFVAVTLALEVIVAHFGEFQAVAQRVAQWFDNTFGTTISNVGIWLQNLAGIANTLLGPAFSNLLSAIKGPHDELDNFAKDINAKMGTQLSYFADFLATQVIPKLAQLVDWVAKNVVPALRTFGSHVADLAGKIAATLLPILKQWADWLAVHVIPKLQQLAGWIVSTLIPAVGQLATWIGDHLVPALGDVVSWYSKLFQAMFILESPIQWLVTHIAGLVVGLVELMGNLGIVTFLFKLWVAQVVFFKALNFLNYLKDLAQFMALMAEMKISMVVDTAKSVASIAFVAGKFIYWVAVETAIFVAHQAKRLAIFLWNQMAQLGVAVAHVAKEIALWAYGTLFWAEQQLMRFERWVTLKVLMMMGETTFQELLTALWIGGTDLWIAEQGRRFLAWTWTRVKMIPGEIDAAVRQAEAWEGATLRFIGEQTKRFASWLDRTSAQLAGDFVNAQKRARVWIGETASHAVEQAKQFATTALRWARELPGEIANAAKKARVWAIETVAKISEEAKQLVPTLRRHVAELLGESQKALKKAGVWALETTQYYASEAKKLAGSALRQASELKGEIGLAIRKLDVWATEKAEYVAKELAQIAIQAKAMAVRLGAWLTERLAVQAGYMLMIADAYSYAVAATAAWLGTLGPIGLTVLAIGAVIAVLAILVARYKWVRDAFDAYFPGMIDGIGWLVDKIKSLGSQVVDTFNPMSADMTKPFKDLQTASDTATTTVLQNAQTIKEQADQDSQSRLEKANSLYASLLQQENGNTTAALADMKKVNGGLAETWLQEQKVLNTLGLTPAAWDAIGQAGGDTWVTIHGTAVNLVGTQAQILSQAAGYKYLLDLASTSAIALGLNLAQVDAAMNGPGGVQGFLDRSAAVEKRISAGRGGPQAEGGKFSTPTNVLVGEAYETEWIVPRHKTPDWMVPYLDAAIQGRAPNQPPATGAAPSSSSPSGGGATSVHASVDMTQTNALLRVIAQLLSMQNEGAGGNSSSNAAALANLMSTATGLRRLGIKSVTMP